MRRISERQIQRIPVVDADQKLAGVVSLGDLSAEGDADAAGDAPEHASLPSEPDRSGFSAAAGAAPG